MSQPGEVLNKELARRGLSVRGFARLLAGPTADDTVVERERRMVNRLRKGSVGDVNARRVSQALGLPKDTFVTTPAQKKDSQTRLRRENAQLRKALARLEALEDAVAENAKSTKTSLAALHKRLALLEKQRTPQDRERSQQRAQGESRNR